MAEILSPSSRFRDLSLKLYKYQNAGVREYWIVDPKNRTVTVYCFEKTDVDPVIYTFADRIPVGISEGKCDIDFARVLQRIEPYLEEESADDEKERSIGS